MVAQQVFGLEVQVPLNLKTGQKDAVYNAHPYGQFPEWVPVAYYSSSLAASMQVEAKLLERGWKRKDQPAESQPGPSHDVPVLLEHRDGRIVTASGAFETALCRAALKAAR